MSINQILKFELINLIKDNNLIIDEIKLKKLDKSSRTPIIILNEIKDEINQLIINKNNNGNNNKIENITLEMIEIEKYNEIKDEYNLIKNENKIMKIDLFNNNVLINDLQYKISEYKKSLKLINNNNNNKFYDDDINKYELSTTDEDNEKKIKIPYNEIPKMSQNKLINEIIEMSNYKYKELIKFSHHNLKQIYNKLNNNKFKRLF